MQTIWKYQIPITDTHTILIPKGGKIVCAAVQHDVPCIWVQVDPSALQTDRYFVLYGTGHPMVPVDQDYIGSFISHDGLLVFHLYEILE